MRVPSYESAARPSQRAFVRLSRSLGGELDDVGKAAMRRPNFFGKPFLRLTQSVLRGPSAWSVGERELFAAVVSRANSCQFCVGTHGEIAAKGWVATCWHAWTRGASVRKPPPPRYSSKR